jgi:hypothetical protein
MFGPDRTLVQKLCHSLARMVHLAFNVQRSTPGRKPDVPCIFSVPSYLFTETFLFKPAPQPEDFIDDDSEDHIDHFIKTRVLGSGLTAY